MIRIDISKCSGCRMCETICSFYHTGRINRNLSRIKVLNLFEIGVDGPIVCQMCKERFCHQNCPSNAITISSLGEVVVSPTNCTYCGACENGCPIGAIELFNNLVYVCDLCGGDPKCVEACNQNALTFENSIKEQISLAKYAKKNLAANIKRQKYLKTLGADLRAVWRGKDE